MPTYHIEKGRSAIIEPNVKKSVSTSDNQAKVSSLLDSIGVFDASTSTPDDLKLVKGIGPQMEQTLNQIGIFSFDQVAKMSQREYDLLDSITGSFPGRAQRDDWAGQAKILNNNK